MKEFLQTILNKNVTISRKISGMNEYIIPLPFTLSVDISVYSVNWNWAGQEVDNLITHWQWSYSSRTMYIHIYF